MFVYVGSVAADHKHDVLFGGRAAGVKLSPNQWSQNQRVVFVLCSLACAPKTVVCVRLAPAVRVCGVGLCCWTLSGFYSTNDTCSCCVNGRRVCKQSESQLALCGIVATIWLVFSVQFCPACVTCATLFHFVFASVTSFMAAVNMRSLRLSHHGCSAVPQTDTKSPSFTSLLTLRSVRVHTAQKHAVPTSELLWCAGN